MKEGYCIFSKNDLIILKNLINLKAPIMTTSLSKKTDIVNKIINPKLEFLNKIKLINIKTNGRKKLISINGKNIEFSKKLISLCKSVLH